jgi:hypothetical protein
MGVCGFCKGRNKNGNGSENSEDGHKIEENKYELIKRKIEVELGHLHSDFRQNIVGVF